LGRLIRAGRAFKAFRPFLKVKSVSKVTKPVFPLFFELWIFSEFFNREIYVSFFLALFSFLAQRGSVGVVILRTTTPCLVLDLRSFLILDLYLRSNKE
jgi:hypothetical protein